MNRLGSDTLARPKLRSYLRAETLADDHILVLSEESHGILRGGAFVHLLPLLDGSRTLPAIVEELDGVVSAAEICYVIDEAAALGYLVDGAGDGEAALPAAAFWHHHGLGAETAARTIVTQAVRLVSVQVRSTGTGHDPVEVLKRSLRRGGARLKDDAALTVVVTDDYLCPALDDLDQEALRSGTPWVLTRLVGTTLWLGPIFVPGRTGCWRCLAQRLEANRQAARYVAERLGQTAPLVPPLGAVPASIELGASLLTTAVLQWLATGANEQLLGHVVTLDVRSGLTRRHRLVRRPQCRRCGPPGAVAKLDPTASFHDVGRRLTMARGDGAGEPLPGPEEAWARMAHHVSPVTGIVSELRPRSRSSSPLAFGYVAVHDFPMFRDDISVLQDNLRGRSGGKGRSDLLARLSAVGEAVERYSGVWRAEEEIAFPARWADLGDRALSLPACLGFSARQVDMRARWNRALDDPHQVVPRPLDPDVEIEWTPVWSLADDEARLIPAAYAYYGHPDMRHLFCFADSNGCAAGPTLERAISRGFMELAERDAVALWWYNRIPRPGLDLDTIGLPYVAELRADYARRGRELWVLDLTSDLGIPTYAALSARTDHAVEDIIMGFGADFDSSVALLGALDELNQSEMSLAGRRPDGSTVYRTSDKGTIRWLTTATRAGHAYLVPSGTVVRLTPQDSGGPGHKAVRSAGAADTTETDPVAVCVDIARRAGLETFVLDQTRPDVGIPVARVIVPGLCHFWRRLGYRRLYDVPVELGWLERPTPEAELNPFSVYF